VVEAAEVLAAAEVVAAVEAAKAAAVAAAAVLAAAKVEVVVGAGCPSSPVLACGFPRHHRCR